MSAGWFFILLAFVALLIAVCVYTSSGNPFDDDETDDYI